MAAPSYNGTETTLEYQARSLLASSIRQIDDGTLRLYPAPCRSVEGVLDSTTTLVTARAFSKVGRSDLAWDFLRTLFSAQGSNGFLPKLVYLNHTDADGHFEGSRWEYFVGPYPGPRLFSAAPKGHAPHSSINNGKPQRLNIWSSNTLIAPPYHATLILEVFYLSNQTDADVLNLEAFYEKLQSWHGFLHKQTIANCSRTNTVHAVPCLPVRHPWETEIDMSSPLWDIALGNVTKIAAAESWTPGFEIPASVKSTFDYPGDETYNALLYLLECNHIESMDQKHASRDHFRSACPFQMLDVGFTAALSRADQDLMQIGQILIDKNCIEHSSWDSMELAKESSLRSKRMLHGSWDEDSSTFSNRLVNFTQNANGTYTSNHTTTMNLPLGYNFLAFWDTLSNASTVESMSSHLLQHSGQFSFYCGEYPLQSIGGCIDPSPPIVYFLNYQVARGLTRNNEHGIRRYLQSSSLNLICGLPNSEEADLDGCIDQRQFATAFNATTLPLGTDTCGLTSTLTAATVLDMLIPDKPFRYESEPPISSSSVIFLIAVEMAVAFGVGIICLLLSLNLMRRAQADEEGDSFVQIIQEQQEEDLLVQSPVEDPEEAGNNHHFEMTDPSSWTALLSHFSPTRLWEKPETATQSYDLQAESS